MTFKHAFRSGMTSKTDLEAAIVARAPVGVVAGALTTVQKQMTLPRALRGGVPVFIDSGAFTAFTKGTPVDFDRVIGVYQTVAAHVDADQAADLYVVSPDAVGDQIETLRLIDLHRDSLLDLIDAGVNVIVPLQRGAIPAREMLARAKCILGTDQFVAGIPSNAEALSISECATLDHDAFHILGRVQIDAEQAARIEALHNCNPCADITADANWMRSRIAEICQRTDVERSRLYSRGHQIGQQTARGAALTSMINESLWGAVTAAAPSQSAFSF